MLSQWRVDRRSEGLHLDFKQGAFETRDTKNDVRPSDLKNLAKSLSAFGNTDGGVLIFGPETERGAAKADVLKVLRAVDAPLDEYTERLRLRVKDSTTPVIPGVVVEPFADPEHPNSGVVAVYIPITDGTPYRAEGPDPGVSGKYFIRTTSDSIIMPHQLLSAMCGRRPYPRFRVGLSKNGDGSVRVRVHNYGRSMAVRPMLRLQVIRPPGSEEPPGLNSVVLGYWSDRLSDILNGTSEIWDIAAVLDSNFRLYPNETRTVAHIKLTEYTRLVRVRVDCDDAMPFEYEERVTIGEQEVWLQEPTSY